MLAHGGVCGCMWVCLQFFSARVDSSVVSDGFLSSFTETMARRTGINVKRSAEEAQAVQQYRSGGLRITSQTAFVASCPTFEDTSQMTRVKIVQPSYESDSFVVRTEPCSSLCHRPPN